MLEVETQMANQCLERYSISLIIRKIQIKSRYHFLPIRLVKTYPVHIFGHVENGNTGAWVEGYK